MRRRVVPSQAVIHGDILGHTRSRPDRYAPRNHLKIHPNDSLSVTNVRPDVFDQHVAAPTGRPPPVASTAEGLRRSPRPSTSKFST